MADYRKNITSDQKAGELRHRVTFLLRNVTVQGGISKETWEPAFTCWAAVEPLSGREYYLAAAVNREEEIRFILRYRRNVDNSMRLRFQGLDYNIIAITDPQMKHAKLVLLAKSVVPNDK